MIGLRRPAREAAGPGFFSAMGEVNLEAIWVHGGLALLAGIVILIFPKIFFYLIGGFFLVNGLVAFLYGGREVMAIALAVGGLLVLIFPKLVGWFIAFYLLLFGGFLLLTGVLWFLAVPVIVLALIVLLAPNIISYLIGAFLALSGAVTLLVHFAR